MQLSDLAARIDRLERENRRWKRLAGGALAAAVAVVGLGLQRPGQRAPEEAGARTLEAARFVLRGADGGEAAVLGLDHDGNPNLLMRRGEANALLTLSGPGLLLRGDDGKRTAYMGFDSRGTGKLTLASSRILDGVRLSVAPDGASSVGVVNLEGRGRAALEFLPEGDSRVVVRDDRGAVRGSLGLEEDGTPYTVLLDENGVRRVGMLVDPEEDGRPHLGLHDSRARPRAELTTTFDGTPILALRNADGKTAFRAP